MKKVIAILVPLLIVVQCNPDKKEKIDLNFHTPGLQMVAPGIISTKLYERDIAISPDGKEIIYTLGDYRQSRRCLVIIKQNGHTWGNREILNFSGRYSDIEPFFSTDGKKLYFASNRPVGSDTGRTDYNIWVSERKGEGWGEPVSLPPIINTVQDEFFPSLGKNNNLYFTAARENGIGREDIYISRYLNGDYTEPVPLDSSVNSATYEFNAYVNPDEDLIIFSSYGRKDDQGGGDLYCSSKDQNGHWRPSVNMGPGVNSDKLDYCPFLDYARGNFYFTSERMKSLSPRIESVSDIDNLANDILNGMGNIYRVSQDQLKFKK
jgi:hypothetical protein